MNRFSAGLKSSSPLLKQGAPTRFGVDNIGGLFPGSHADPLALRPVSVPVILVNSEFHFDIDLNRDGLAL